MHRRYLAAVLPLFLVLAHLAHAADADQPKPVVSYWPVTAATEDAAWTGRLVRYPDLGLLTVRGSARDRGTAHGKLLAAEVRQLVKSVRGFLAPTDTPEERTKYAKRLEAARTMGGFLETDVLQEVNACAEAAGADATELLLAQLFGDVNRVYGFASFCSAFAAFGPATRDGALVVGRNFDYAGHGLEGGIPVILQEIPAGVTGTEAGATRPFVTIGYAGILNGWTAMNDQGLCASNNTLFSGEDRIEGISTCFMLRKVVERCRTVEEGVAIIERGPRACTTGMLVAGKNAKGEWDARFVEYDAVKTALVQPVAGRVQATNGRQMLAGRQGASNPDPNPGCSRYQTLKKELDAQAGKVSFDAALADTRQNPAALSGVYMSINLHCALLDPGTQRILLAVTPDHKPAAEHPFRAFRVQPTRIDELPCHRGHGEGKR
jgi:hypothetical protein